MKTYKVELQIYSLVGFEVREIEVKAMSEASARKKVAMKMGNRDFLINTVVVKS